MKIPFIDLEPQFRPIDRELQKVTAQVLKSRQFILGPTVADFEKQVVKKIGVKHAFGVASGSDAIWLSLVACGVGPGDEVITTPFTFFATAGMISKTGAKPVFVDIDREIFNIDPSQIQRAITKKTKAIIPVNLYGLSADLDPILKCARQNNLIVIEDSAQSFGAIYKGKQSGSIADVGCYSFYPSKNFGGCGDGGMVVTSSDKIADQVKLLRDYGSRKKYFHEIVGVNSRLDAIQAAILSVKLKFIDRWNESRRKAASRYDRGLSGLPLQTPVVPKGREHTYHLYTIKSRNRDALAAFLNENGVGTGIYYPVPLHLQECYKSLGYRKGDLPVTEELSSQILSLPMFAGITEKQTARVISVIKKFSSSTRL